MAGRGSFGAEVGGRVSVAVGGNAVAVGVGVRVNVGGTSAGVELGSAAMVITAAVDA